MCQSLLCVLMCAVVKRQCTAGSFHPSSFWMARVPTAGPKCKLMCKYRNKQINGKKTELLTVFFYSNDVTFSMRQFWWVWLRCCPFTKAMVVSGKSTVSLLGCIWCLHPHVHMRTQSVYACVSSLRGDRDIEPSSFLSS